MQQETKSKILNLIMVVMTPILMLSICHTVYTDKRLSGYASLVMMACAFFFICCCVCNLSVIATLRRKESARNVPDEMLTDSDLESDYESVNITPIRRWSWYELSTMIRNVYEFGRFHLAYGIVLGVSLVHLLAALVSSALTVYVVNDSNLQDDLCLCAVHFCIPGVVLLLALFAISNMKGAYKKDIGYMNYNPFEDVVEIPMRFLAGRTFATFLTGGSRYITEFFVGLVLLMYSFYAFCFLLEMEQNEIRNWQESFNLESIHSIFLGIMAFTIIIGASLMARVLKGAYKKAKNGLFVTMEQNWHRNLVACEYLLPGETLKTLDGLQHILLKRRRRTLTSEDKFAFEYISLPLWKHKQPFALKRK